MVRLISVFVLVVIMDGLAQADCSGRAARATPVRNMLAARPVATILQRVRASRKAVGCSGSVQAAPSCGCAGSAVVPSAPAPTVKLITVPAEPVYELFQAPKCNGDSCEVARTPVRDAVSSLYQQALASAQYRASNRIKGHSHLDTHRTSGVGWASHNDMPATCLGVGTVGVDYASVRGPDGWYSTRLQ